MKTKEIKHLHHWDQHRINVLAKEGVNKHVATVLEYLSKWGWASTIDISRGTKLTESHAINAITWLSAREYLYTERFHISGAKTDKYHILACQKKYIIEYILYDLYERTRYLPKKTR